jgi:propanol-preferring alcohol dehydrogenase
MRAMVLRAVRPLAENPAPLELAEWPDPAPGAGEILIRVSACGVCHTELDEIEGRTPPRQLPMILGHQVVGRVEARGESAERFPPGVRVGVAWIFAACGTCDRCRRSQENLCEDFRATGRDVPGGYAELMTVPEAFAHEIPDGFSDAEAAPLLCAGAIGYRSLRLTGLENGSTVGLTGFGASAHLVLMLVRHRFPATRVFVFARTAAERDFARHLGAAWTGDTREQAPEPLDAIIDTTPAWTPIVEALLNLKPGGRLVVNAIRKEDHDKSALMALDYSHHLWLEKEIKTVANVTRDDVRELLRLAAEIPIKPQVEQFALEAANQALLELRAKSVRGAKVLRVT